MYRQQKPNNSNTQKKSNKQNDYQYHNLQDSQQVFEPISIPKKQQTPQQIAAFTNLVKILKYFHQRYINEKEEKNILDSNRLEQASFTPQQKQLHKKYLNDMWEYRYWRLVDNAVDGQCSLRSKSKSIDQSFMSDRSTQQILNNKKVFWLKVFGFVGEYQQKCISLLKDLVNSNFNKEQLQAVDHRYAFKKEGQIGIYCIDNIVIRVAHGKKLKKSKKTNRGFKENYSQESDASNQFQAFNMNAVKGLHQQYLGYNVLNNLFISLAIQDPSLPKLRVPLTCIVKYMGYTALCQADTPCDGLQTLIYGPTGSLFQYRSQVLQLLTTIGSNLNLKPFKIQSPKGEIIQIPFSLTVQLHKITSVFKNETIINWINPSSYLYPHHQRGNRLKKPQYYILNTEKLWPLFIDSDIRKSIGFLRPQIVLSSQTMLSNSVFSNINTFRDQKGQLQLANACKTLKQDVIKSVCKMLDEAVFYLLDSYSIQQLLHMYGINMKFLGVMASSVDLAFNKRIFETQMMARTLCRIFFTNATQMKGKVPIKDLFVDFLNLIFIKGKEGSLFFKNILYPEIKQYYSYTITDYPPNLQGGGLLHAICYHFGVKMKQIDYPFFQDLGKQSIFYSLHIIDIVGYSKSFTFDTCEIKKICETYKKEKQMIVQRINQIYFLLKENRKDLTAIFMSQLKPMINQCKTKIKLLACINSLLSGEGSFSVGSLPQSFYEAQLGQLCLTIDQYDQAMKQAQLSLKSIPEKHADAIKAYRILIKYYSKKGQLNRCLQYYQKSLACLNYHLSQSHPLSITIYKTLGTEFINHSDPEKCQKIFAKSFDICEQTLGHMHKTSANILLQLSQLPLQPDKVINFLQQALTILQNLNSEGNQINKVTRRISQLNLELGNLSKVILFARRSNHWKMQITALQKLNQSRKVLDLCNRPPETSEELIFLIDKAFTAYLKLLEYVQISNLYKLCVALKDHILKDLIQVVNRLNQKLQQDKLNKPTITDYIKGNLSYLISQLPQLLLKKQFYKDIFSTFSNKNRKIKYAMENYMDILAIVGIEKAEILLTSNKKTF